ncbi:class I SAM-dependent methyltransferase [Amorphus orientalis]|uniref:Ubiquinone/menaquinone biosynthesis C-methylase UbiE n=1 Tax=Amorphus orientalis TaxID=649198 RepID=A0AAE3VLX4_9HYPH|nr:class I SAM-dependent methyltransferase [Amorphus orientalis]MDQ0314358.1 ubiquinone/menaquinone biosynthesis C-methylase UbiE [Amorphus orientalis]
MALTPFERFSTRARFVVSQGARVGWYGTQSILASRMVDRIGRSLPEEERRTARTERPVPSRAELFADVRNLLLRDMRNVEAGLYPMPRDERGGIAGALRRSRAYFDDLPEVVRRRHTHSYGEVGKLPSEPTRPDYYLQNFHFQSDGWMSEHSARLYDTQVETLFLGAAAAMRRQALVPIAGELARRDQRRMGYIDLGCGTGSFLRTVNQAFPRLATVGVDLSEAYAAHTRDAVGSRPRTGAVVAAGETLPFADRGIDIATAIYLFHELPPEVRTTVARELARAVRPKGLVVIVDSLQFGDRPDFDGLLEIFPQLFHEPYYRGYLVADLNETFEEAGFAVEDSFTAFLSKVTVLRRKSSRVTKKS